jgi:hypothetical protein
MSIEYLSGANTPLIPIAILSDEQLVKQDFPKSYFPATLASLGVLFENIANCRQSRFRKSNP